MGDSSFHLGRSVRALRSAHRRFANLPRTAAAAIDAANSGCAESWRALCNDSINELAAAAAPSFSLAAPALGPRRQAKLGAGASTGSCRRALSRHETGSRRSEFLSCSSSARAPCLLETRSWRSEFLPLQLQRWGAMSSRISEPALRVFQLVRPPSVTTAEDWEPALRVSSPAAPAAEHCRGTKLEAGAPSFSLAAPALGRRPSDVVAFRNSEPALRVFAPTSQRHHCRKLGAGVPRFCSDIPVSSLPKIGSRRSEWRCRILINVLNFALNFRFCCGPSERGTRRVRNPRTIGLGLSVGLRQKKSHSSVSRPEDRCMRCALGLQG